MKKASELQMTPSNGSGYRGIETNKLHRQNTVAHMGDAEERIQLTSETLLQCLRRTEMYKERPSFFGIQL